MPDLDPPSDRDALARARESLGNATRARLARLADVRRVARERDAMRRQQNDDHAEQRYADAVRELQAALSRERDVRIDLRTRLAGLPSPEDAITGLDRQIPLVLFPVRIETRFVRFQEPIDRPDLPDQTGELRVRIYPDGLLADSHEPLLTETELAAGRDYWRTAWRDADERDAWTALVAEVGAPRAAWIVRQCEPTNQRDFPSSPAAPGESRPGPVFPERETRPANWQRTPEARLLPDRWVVIATPDRAVTDAERARYRITSRAIVEPLALTLALGTEADGVVDNRITLSDDLRVDPEIEWTFDFGRAEEVGMAVRIPLTADDFNDGFARVLVLGVGASRSPAESAAEMAALFESHRYSRGLAFVPQGTPTNNTAGASSGYPPPDPRAAASFRVERGAPLTRNGGDGAAFMRALGLPASAADHVGGADGAEQRRARAMAAALWPSTLGYYMKQMLASALDVPDQPADLDDATIERLRRHFLDHVRGRGPFPAFRVGDVPYGLLPVSDLMAAEPAPDEPPAGEGFDRHLRFILSQLWTSHASMADRLAPRVGRSADVDADLMDTFRMDASAREVYIRPAVGEDTIDNLAGMAGGDTDRIREPIPTTEPLDLGGPRPDVDSRPSGELTLQILLGLSGTVPDVIGAEDGGGLPTRPPTDGGPLIG